MRILYIHQYFATPRGHTGTRSYAQARAMIAAGHGVTVLTSVAQLRPDEVPPGRGLVRRGRVGGIPVIVLTIPYAQRMGYARRLGSFALFMLAASWVALTEPGIDLVYATSTPLTVGIPALLARGCRAIPYVFEVRDLWPDVPIALGVIRSRLLAWALGAVERALYRQARLVVAMNGPAADAIARKVGGGRRILVVPNACDADFFRPDRKAAAFRPAHGLQGQVVAVSAGAMGPVNGLDAVLDAARRLRDLRDLRFVLIGDGSRRAALERRAAAEGLANVLLLPEMPKADLAGVLAACDIGLVTVAPVPILELNCANKFFDYLASGLPVVLNYGGWQGDLVRAEGCGLAGALGDADAFSRNIRRLASDPAARAAMARSARHVAETRLARPAVLAPLLGALGRLDPRR